MATPHLNLTEVAASQNQKHVTINNALVGIDNAMNAGDVRTVAGTFTLTNAAFRGSFAFQLGGTPGGAFTLNVPGAIRRSFAVINGTDAACTVQVDGGAGVSVEVPTGQGFFLYSDGTDITSLGGGAGGGAGSVGIEDEGVSVLTEMTSINFAGAGVSVADDGDGTATVTIPGLNDAPVRSGVFRGVRATRSTAQALASGGWTALSFDAEAFDTTGFHSTSVNPERLTVPTGYGIRKVNVVATLRFDDFSGTSTGWVVARLMKNGVEVSRGWGDLRFITDNRIVTTVYGGVQDVVAGDYFSLEVFTGEAGTLAAQGTFFEMTVVEDQSNTSVAFGQNWSVPHRGALAYLTANDTAVNLGSVGPYNWDATQYDTDGFWDGAQPARFTIPAGITKVRLAGLLRIEAITATASVYVVVRKNGSAAYKGVGIVGDEAGFTNQVSSVTTGVIEVVEGDYFDLAVQYGSQTSETVLAAESYFQIEVVETTDAQARLFDVSTFIPGTPSAGATVLQTVMTRSATLRATAPAAQAFAGVAATGSTVFDITKNGVAVGTITWSAAGQVGAFSVASDVTFVAGDRIAIIAENPADATLADVSISIPIAVG